MTTNRKLKGLGESCLKLDDIDEVLFQTEVLDFHINHDEEEKHETQQPMKRQIIHKNGKVQFKIISDPKKTNPVLVEKDTRPFSPSWLPLDLRRHLCSNSSNYSSRNQIPLRPQALTAISTNRSGGYQDHNE